MNDKKISVIMPVYNAEKNLKSCIESILAQKLEGVEIICINDCSSDSSLEILESYVAKDDRFIIINNEKNEGPGICRNKGIEIARGEYLSFIDADDRFEDEMLLKCYYKAKETDADVLVFNYMTFNSETGVINKEFAVPYVVRKKLKSYITPELIKEYIFNIFDVCAWNKIYKREFIKENNIIFADFSYGEDMFFSLLSLALAKKIAYLDEYLYYYTIKQKSSASSIAVMKDKYFLPYKAIKLVKYALESRNLFEKYKKSLNLLLFENVNCHLTVLGDDSNKLVQVIHGEREFEYGKYLTNSIKENHMNLLFSNEKKICKTFDNFMRNDNIALWGVALRGQAFLDVIDRNKIKIGYLVDKDVSKQGKMLNGVKVNNYDDVKDKVDLIIATNSYFYEAILRETNNDKRLFDMNAYLNYGLDFDECFN